MKQWRVLIAPNAFKHSLNAEAVALAIQKGLQQSQLDCVCNCFPVGDGGDGTGNLLVKKYDGETVWVPVQDPLGRTISASYGLVNNGETAIVEMASASGIRLIKSHELNPLQATSFGTGSLIKHALDQGAKKIVLAVGGSATVDGGMGILQALGVRFTDAAGQPITTTNDLIHLANIDCSTLDQRIFSAFTILCDVENTLLGEQGAAAVFGPQKGATPDAVQRLDTGLAMFAKIALEQTGFDMVACKHGGAAGGVAAGLYAFFKAQLVNGIDFFLDFTGFEQALNQTDLVITGEGSIDEQTLQGKGPYGVAYRARQKNLPVIGLAGSVPLELNVHLNLYFDLLLSISNGPADLSTALGHTEQNLIRTAHQLGNFLNVCSLC